MLIIFFMSVGLLSSFLIGLGMGGKGSRKNQLINYGVLITLFSTIVVAIFNWKWSLCLAGGELVVIYTTLFFFNKRYGGFDIGYANLEAERSMRELQKLIDKKLK